VRPVLLADHVDLRNVRVRQLGHAPGFRLEALGHMALCRQLRRQYLDGHIALQRGLAGTVHHSHPAAAQLIQQFEVIENLRHGVTHLRSAKLCLGPW